VADEAMQRRVRQILLGLTFLMTTLGARAAHAADWRYCLAPSSGDRIVYVSTPFPEEEPLETIESAFGRALDYAHLRHDSVQCPRGDADTIAAMKVQTTEFNEASGSKVVQLNWRP
jgi:hypothetical protein